MNFSAYEFKLKKKKNPMKETKKRKRKTERKQTRNNLSHLKLQI